MTRVNGRPVGFDGGRVELAHIFARYLVTRAGLLSPPPGDDTGYDAKDGAGIRYRVVGHREDADPAGVVVPPIPRRAFDRIVSVVFGRSFEVKAVRMVWVEPFLERAGRQPWSDGRVLPVDDDFWIGPEVDDLTPMLQSALARVGRTGDDEAASASRPATVRSPARKPENRRERLRT